jgi:DNA-binding HxlR family transcriptional regulator
MLRSLFSKKVKSEEAIVKAVVSQTAELINQFHQQMDLRFHELSTQIKELELSLGQMETKLLTKDLKDKQAYGLLHYKIHEVKNEKLEQEINSLETNLKARKESLKDQ